MTATISPLVMTDEQIQAAAAAWQSGGTLMLGLWLARFKKHFTVADYGALVELVRAELNDDTDYSQVLEAA